MTATVDYRRYSDGASTPGTRISSILAPSMPSRASQTAVDLPHVRDEARKGADRTPATLASSLERRWESLDTLGTLLASIARTVEQPSAPEAGEALRRLRQWTGLSVGGVADLLGVARRSLYHWTSGATRPRQATTLFGLVRVLEPFSAVAEPWELLGWLRDAQVEEALRQSDLEAVRRMLGEALGARGVAVLNPVRPDHHEEVEPLEATEIRRYFLAAAKIRPTRTVVRRIPRELTDSAAEDDE